MARNAEGIFRKTNLTSDTYLDTIEMSLKYYKKRAFVKFRRSQDPMGPLWGAKSA